MTPFSQTYHPKIQRLWLNIFLVIILSCSSYCSNCVINPTLRLKKYPSDIEEGSSFTLTCTSPTFISDNTDIFINNSHFETGEETKHYGVKISNRTVQLIVSNVTKLKDDYDKYRCYSSNSSGDILCSDLEVIHIIRRPMKPVIDNCSFNFDRVLCRWRPTIAEQLKYTYIENSNFISQTLYWKLNRSGDDSWKQCKNPISTYFRQNRDMVPFCILDEVSLGEEFCIKVVAYNSLRIYVTSDVSCFNISNIVLVETSPSISHNIMSIKFCNSSWEKIHWTPPSLPPQVQTKILWIYNISYQSQWDQMLSSIITNETEYYIQVHPYTHYNVTVQVKTAVDGHWSKPGALIYVTEPSVPCKQPIVKQNAFFITSSNPRSIVLYWKSVPIKDHCGPGLVYEVISQSNAAGTKSSIPSNFTTSTKISLDNHSIEATEVQIRAKKKKVPTATLR